MAGFYGVYEFEEGQKIEIYSSNEKLYIKFNRGSTFQLLAIEDNLYIIKNNDDVCYSFVNKDDGKDRTLIQLFGENKNIARKLSG